MTKYYIDIPNVDPDKPWHIIKEFDSKEEAIKYCDRIFGTEFALYCLLSFDGDYWVVDVPNPNYTSTNNQFLNVEGFHHKSDALDYAQSCYNADEEGCISLISKV